MNIPVYVDASPSPGLHISIAVFNILPTLCVTLGETDRLCAAQTSTAVGHSAPSLKFVWVVSKSPQNGFYSDR